MQRWIATAVLPVLLAACANTDSPANRAVWVEDGPPVNCINRAHVRGFRVIDDQTIDFERNRNQVWRNRLPFRCDGLAFGQKIRVNSRTSQICNLDSITPMGMGSSMARANCPLGQFQPMKRVPAPEAKPAAQG